MGRGTSLPAAVAALPTEAVRTIEPEAKAAVEPPTIDAIIEADNALIDEVTVIEEPPACIEETPVFRPHKAAPVESKPRRTARPENLG